MIRNMLIIAAASFVLMIGCAFGVAAIAGPEIINKGWTLPFDDETVVVRSDGRHIVHKGRIGGPRGGAAEATVDRQFAWTGKDVLTIDLPVDVVFVQGDEAKVVASGPKSYVDRLRVDGGRLTLTEGDDVDHDSLTIDRNGLRIQSDSDRVKITVVAPNVTRFEIEGSGDLDIRRYERDAVALAVSGSGDAFAKGKVASVTVDNSGSGYVDLAELKARDASIQVSGSGGVSVFATGKAKIGISGSGNVALRTEPTSVSSEITGSGEVSRDF